MTSGTSTDALIRADSDSAGSSRTLIEAIPVQCVPVTAGPITSAATAIAAAPRTVTVAHSAAVAATTAMTTDNATIAGLWRTSPWR